MKAEMCDYHCRTEVCDLCGAEIPSHDSGLCIWCEEKLLEMPEELVEVNNPADAVPESKRTWAESNMKGVIR